MLPISEAASGFTIRWFTENGHDLDGPIEWRDLLLAIDVPQSEWESVAVQAGRARLAVSLRRLGDATRIVADWPRSGPGNYDIQVRWKGGAQIERVRIEPAKLAPGEFERLLDDLERQLPVSVAIALQQLGGLGGVDVSHLRHTTLAEEVQRLRRAVIGNHGLPGLADLLRTIARNPHVQLRNTAHWVARHDARRPLPSAMVHALVRSGNLDDKRNPIKVADSRVLHSADVYENRLLATFVKQVDLRMRRLRAAIPESQADLRSDLEMLAMSLHRARRAAPFLDEVAVLRTPPTQVTMVLLRSQGYEGLYRSYRAFHRGLPVMLDSSTFDAPLDNLPYLYQMWGTMQVINEFLAAGAELGYRVESHRLIAQDASGWYVRELPNDAAAVVLRHPERDRKVRLIPERSYRGREQTSGPHSITFAQRPDVVIEVVDGGLVSSVVVFDPKYKLDGEIDRIADTSPLKVDIDKMHAYRDAIRDGEGRHIVAFAGILYPGESTMFSDEIGAIGMRPSDVANSRATLRRLLAGAMT